MRAIWTVCVAAMLGLSATPVSAKSDLERWLNGFTIEAENKRATFSVIAQMVGCCEAEKTKVDQTFDRVLASIAKTKSSEQRRSGLVCPNLDLLELEVGFLASWIGILKLDAQQEKHARLTSDQALGFIEQLEQDVKGMVETVKEMQVETRCPVR